LRESKQLVGTSDPINAETVSRMSKVLDLAINETTTSLLLRPLVTRGAAAVNQDFLKTVE